MQITSKDLTYVYNKKTEFSAVAVEGVTLTVEEGDFFGIIGHTGSGKSTFVQHLNGLIPVQEGSLTVGDFNLALYTKKQFKQIKEPGEFDGACFKEGKKRTYRGYKKERLKRLKSLRAKVGMVFQYPEYQLFGDTVFSDVAFGIKNFFPEYTAEQTEEAVREAVEMVGLNYAEVKDKSPFDLSGGQKRRVAIAGVIVTRPQILVLDEPVAGLDPQGKKELMALLHRLHGSMCKTVIIVSHDMDDVAENCNRVAVFSEGKLLYCLPTEELFKKQEELKAAQLDVPLTARLCGALKERGVVLDTDFTVESFVRAVAEEYKKRS